jgi:hypothetical protein
VFSSASLFSKPISHAIPGTEQHDKPQNAFVIWPGCIPYGNPGEGLSVSLMIGILAFGSGLTSKLVSATFSYQLRGHEATWPRTYPFRGGPRSWRRDLMHGGRLPCCRSGRPGPYLEKAFQYGIVNSLYKGQKRCNTKKTRRFSKIPSSASQSARARALSAIPQRRFAADLSCHKGPSDRRQITSVRSAANPESKNLLAVPLCTILRFAAIEVSCFVVPQDDECSGFLNAPRF